MIKKANAERASVFSSPIRKLSADEIVKVSGGVYAEPGLKKGGGPDNQGHQF